MGQSVLAKMAVLISAQTAEFNKALAASEARLKKFASSAQSSGASITQALSLGGLALGGAQLTSALVGAVNTIKDFEQQMATVRAITGATDSEFNLLRNDALKLGAATKYTATQVAELQTEYGRLGFTTQEILNATKATLSLATATGEDLAKSADVLGSTLRAFNIDASETGRVADVMAGSFNRSALGLENYSEAIKYVAPIAAANNISLEETTALLGILADNGIRGSMAGTSLRKIISDLNSVTGTMTEKLKKLADRGLDSSDALDEVGRTAYASLLILSKNTDRVQSLDKALHNVNGEADRTAKIMGDTLSGDLDRLKSAYDGLVLSGGAFGDVLRELVQAATNLVNLVNNPDSVGILSLLKNLVKYTPNIYTLSKAINGIADDISGDKSIDKTIKRLYELRKIARERGDRNAEIGFTKQLAELASKYGLVKDKAVEWKEETKPEDIDAYVGTLDGLKKKLEELTQEYIRQSVAADSTKDFDRLAELDKEIQGTKNLIDIIEKYRKKTEEKNKEKRKEFALFNAERQSIYALADSYVKLQDDIKKAQEELSKYLNSFNQVSKLPEQIKINDQLRAQIDGITSTVRKAAKELIDLGPIVSNAVAGIADAFGSALGTGDFSNFGDAILRAVADFAKQLGSLMISIGVGELALQSGNPYVMIAAGAALVAAGAALSAHLEKQKTLVTGTTGGVSGGDNASLNSFNDAGVMQIQIGGEFTVRGRDLVTVLDQQNIRSQRTG